MVGKPLKLYLGGIICDTIRGLLVRNFSYGCKQAEVVTVQWT